MRDTSKKKNQKSTYSRKLTYTHTRAHTSHISNIRVHLCCYCAQCRISADAGWRAIATLLPRGLRFASKIVEISSHIFMYNYNYNRYAYEKH